LGFVHRSNPRFWSRLRVVCVNIPWRRYGFVFTASPFIECLRVVFYFAVFVRTVSGLAVILRTIIKPVVNLHAVILRAGVKCSE
jgi:hypothetical protein